jgi:hypothetical protein
MGSNKRYPSEHPPVSIEALKQVEPDNPDGGWSRPISLTSEELGRSTPTVTNEPIAITAWVRYPAQAMRVQGRALAWTPRAVYVEWQGNGVHRTWVWASAVDRR